MSSGVMTDTSDISSVVQILQEMRLLNSKLDKIDQVNRSLQADIQRMDQQLQQSLTSAENDSVEAS